MYSRRPRLTPKSARKTPFIALPSLDDLPPELRGPPSVLDTLYSELVLSTEIDSNPTSTLYGAHASRGKPRTVWVASFCTDEPSDNARAGAGILWSLQSPRNMAIRTPGKQCRRRAAHFAVVAALLQSQSEFDLIIITDRKDVIRTYCFWTSLLKDEGWTAPDSDVIRYAVHLMQRRWGRVEFRWAKTRPDYVLIPQISQSRELAEGACSCSVPYALPVLPLERPRPPIELVVHPSGIPKIFTILPVEPPPPTEPEETPLLAPRDWCQPSENNDRRRIVRQRQWEIYNTFIDACRQSEPLFWSTVRELTDPKPSQPQVSLPDLAAEFEKRIHVPDALPPEFDAIALELAALECSVIPSITTDRTLRRSFSRHFIRAEILKNRKRVCHRLTSSPGFDTTTYKLFLSLTDDALLRFFNMCLDLRSAPRLWMITILIGILKPGKDAKDPASYRLIGLESCLLKMFTLLWDDRFREWMEDEKILPDSQNGFRRGFHGLNNPFILRCAIEAALGSGRPLYVVLPDLTNAFPSTDRSLLWVMMYKRGAGGALFDWLRSMYNGMRYCVKMGDSYSHTFDSDIGILAGDGTSPSVWDFFGSDFTPRQHPDDVCFGDRHILNVEHADDGALWSTSPAGIQFHCDDYGPWTRRKGLLINYGKTKVLAHAIDHDYRIFIRAFFL